MFTFNGQGEYTLVKVDESGFVLQGRTEPVTSDTNQATRFTAFAFGFPSENIVIEVRIGVQHRNDTSPPVQNSTFLFEPVGESSAGKIDCLP